MKHVRVSYNNTEDKQEEDNRSSNGAPKLDEEDNALRYCHKNNDNSDEDEDKNAGEKTIFLTTWRGRILKMILSYQT